MLPYKSFFALCVAAVVTVSSADATSTTFGLRGADVSAGAGVENTLVLGSNARPGYRAGAGLTSNTATSPDPGATLNAGNSFTGALGIRAGLESGAAVEVGAPVYASGRVGGGPGLDTGARLGLSNLDADSAVYAVAGLAKSLKVGLEGRIEGGVDVGAAFDGLAGPTGEAGLDAGAALDAMASIAAAVVKVDAHAAVDAVAAIAAYTGIDANAALGVVEKVAGGFNTGERVEAGASLGVNAAMDVVGGVATAARIDVKAALVLVADVAAVAPKLNAKAVLDAAAGVYSAVGLDAAKGFAAIAKVAGMQQ